MKKNKSTALLTTLICLLPIILSVTLFEKLPEQIPVHFNNSGQVNGYLPKLTATIGLPVILAIINLFVHFKVNTDPKRQNYSNILKIISKWLVPLVSLIFVPISIFYSLGYGIPIQIVAPCIVGVLLMIIGNYLPKNKQNFAIGIKLPWTLNNEKNWNKTNKLAGYLLLFCGALIIITSLTQFGGVFSTIFIILVPVIVPFVYSYILYQQGT